MRLFATGKGRLEEIEAIHPKESDLRHEFDENLDKFFSGLDLVKKECPIGDVIIDTLAFDRRAKAFVIIEYKKKKSSSVMDQGLSYINKLQQHKGDCIQHLMEARKDGKPVYERNIDWDKNRLILVGPSFTKYQIDASASYDRIELHQFHKYPNHLIVSAVNAPGKERTPVRPKRKKRSRSITKSSTCSEADWLDPKDGRGKPLPEIHDLYLTLRKTLIDQFQLRHVQRKRWASFRLGDTEVCSVVLRKRKFQITYSTVKKDLLPPSSFVKNVSRVGRWGRGNYRSDISTESDISRAVKYVSLVCQDVSNSGRSSNKPATTTPPDPTGYSEADWLDGKYGGPKLTPQVRDLYSALKGDLLDKFHLDHIQKNKYASFRLKNGTKVCDVICRQQKLQIVYAASKGLFSLNDFLEDVSNKNKWGTGNYRSNITTESDVSRAVEYVGRVYQAVSGL